jgi:hypothetical protein
MGSNATPEEIRGEAATGVTINGADYLNRASVIPFDSALEHIAVRNEPPRGRGVQSQQG